MAYVATFDSYLLIDAVPMNVGAWEHLNLAALYSGADVRGSNLAMPGAVGVRALRHRPTETNRTLDLHIFGDRKWDGTAHSDPEVGLHLNLAHLMANVVDPLATTNSTRTATLVRPGATKVAAIQVLGFEIGTALTPWCVAASMDITIIEGRFL